MQLLNATTDGRPKGGIFIGRGSAVGNPYVLTHEDRRKEVVYKYRLWLLNRLFSKDLKVISFLEKIQADSQLVCFCAPKLCHGDVIINLLNYINKFDQNLSFKERLDLCLKEIYPKTLNQTYDGVTHINIYSKASTKLGKMLSNFYPCNIVLENKTFGSLEAYWYWLSTGRQHDSLISLSGFEAKKQGRQFPKVHIDDFENLIKTATEQKLLQNPDIKKEFLDSKLAFEHYYRIIQKDGSYFSKFATKYYWQVNHFTSLREAMQ